MTAQADLEARLARIERVLLGLAAGVAQMSGQACLQPVSGDLAALRSDVRARDDG
jgi:hypothetical protein